MIGRAGDLESSMVQCRLSPLTRSRCRPHPHPHLHLLQRLAPLCDCNVQCAAWCSRRVVPVLGARRSTRRLLIRSRC